LLNKSCAKGDLFDKLIKREVISHKKAYIRTLNYLYKAVYLQVRLTAF